MPPRRRIAIIADDSDDEDDEQVAQKRFRIPKKPGGTSLTRRVLTDDDDDEFPGGGLRHLAGGGGDSEGDSDDDVEDDVKEEYSDGVEDDVPRGNAPHEDDAEEVVMARGSSANAAIDVGASDVEAEDSDGQDSDGDHCWTCGRAGTLVCCDGPGCEAQHHLSCVGLEAVPTGDWLCPKCMDAGVGKKRKGKEKASAPAKEKGKSRKVIDDNDLAESTKAAMAAEAARREAINLVSPTKKPKPGGGGGGGGGAASSHISIHDSDDDDDGDGDDDILVGAPQPFVLNPDEVADTPSSAVRIQAGIASQMKPHQKEAARFLFENLVVNLEALRGGNSYAAVFCPLPHHPPALSFACGSASLSALS